VSASDVVASSTQGWFAGWIARVEISTRLWPESPRTSHPGPVTPDQRLGRRVSDRRDLGCEDRR
jgi:hypothetical protein